MLSASPQCTSLGKFMYHLCQVKVSRNAGRWPDVSSRYADFFFIPQCMLELSPLSESAHGKHGRRVLASCLSALWSGCYVNCASDVIKSLKNLWPNLQDPVQTSSSPGSLFRAWSSHKHILHCHLLNADTCTCSYIISQKSNKNNIKGAVCYFSSPLMPGRWITNAFKTWKAFHNAWLTPPLWLNYTGETNAFLQIWAGLIFRTRNPNLLWLWSRFTVTISSLMIFV